MDEISFIVIEFASSFYIRLEMISEWINLCKCSHMVASTSSLIQDLWFQTASEGAI